MWKLEIFPNWENHFDYKKRRPIAFELYRNLCAKEKKHATKPEKKLFFSCFTTKNSNKSQFYFSNDLEEKESIPAKKNHHNQFLLVKLWKSGFPDWVRKTLWPIIIGNQLEVLLL